MSFAMNRPDRRPVITPNIYSVANYSTENMKKTTFGDEIFLKTNLHLIPDPLKKNLADTIITEDKKAPKSKLNNEDLHNAHNYSPVSGIITSFFSGVMNVISSAMFSKRKQSEFVAEPDDQMAVDSMWHGAKTLDENKILQDENRSNENTSEVLASEMTDCTTAAAHCQNKIEQVRLLLSGSQPVPCHFRARKRPKRAFVEASSVEDNFEDAFSPEDFETIANRSFIEFSSPVCYHDSGFHEIDGPKVKTELAKTPEKVPELPQIFETTEIVTNVPEIVTKNKNKLECNTKPEVVPTNEDKPNKLECHTKPEVVPTNEDKPNKLESDTKPEVFPANEDKPKLECDTKPQVVARSEDKPNKLEYHTKPEVVPANEDEPKLECDTKPEVVTKCEDKLNKLKALLQDRKKTLKPSPIIEPPPVAVPHLPKFQTKVKDKRFKNPNRTCGKRVKSKMRKSIQDDLQFANEIDIEDPSSVENSPSMSYLEKMITTTKPETEYFDEVSGRFRPGSFTESEDSFQIVFNDSPRPRTTSDCESEDSFIVFEDSPDSCYTSNDVFGETSGDSEDCDSDSDVSDSGCGNSSFNLAGSLSKSVSNLADDNLYEEHSEDEVDCAKVTDVTVYESTDLGCAETGEVKTGLLLNDRKKLQRKKLPAKRVQFSVEPPKVHVMRVWSFAARQARAGHWERYALDRERFKRRIADVEVAISWVLKPQHRCRVMFQRIMPFRNAQKRKEIAERNEREAQERLRKEEEALRDAEVENQKTVAEDGENCEPSGDYDVKINGSV